MVIPCLTHHLHGHRCTENTRRGGTIYRCRSAFTTAGNKPDDIPQTDNSHTYPYSIGIERTRKCVITLSRLTGWLVKIEHNRDSGHEKQEEHNPELLYASLTCECLPQKTDKTQYKRKHVIDIVSGVILSEIIGKKRLVSETCIVDYWDSGNPVAGIKLA